MFKSAEFVKWTCPTLNVSWSVVKCGDIRVKMWS